MRPPGPPRRTDLLRCSELLPCPLHTVLEQVGRPVGGVG